MSRSSRRGEAPVEGASWYREPSPRPGPERSRAPRRRARGYSDFLLHDVGTGDGIPVLPTPELAETASQIRTAPRWGLRTRNRLMHDGLSFTKQEAIERHAGQAAGVTSRDLALGALQRGQLMAFLDSL